MEYTIIYIYSDISLYNENITCRQKISVCRHQYEKIRKSQEEKHSFVMQQNIRIYVKLLGEIKNYWRSKRIDWMDRYTTFMDGNTDLLRQQFFLNYSINVMCF